MISENYAVKLFTCLSRVMPLPLWANKIILGELCKCETEPVYLEERAAISLQLFFCVKSPLNHTNILRIP